MPVRSLTSSVLIWPDAKTVDRAVRVWAEQLLSQKPEVLRIGYFGSYARGDWGVGSDLDLILIVTQSEEEPFERRSIEWDVTSLPVPAEILIYTIAEWEALTAQNRFKQAILAETIWVYEQHGK